MLTEPAEIGLHGVLGGLRDTVTAAVAEHRYADALRASAGLRAAVDQFFDQVMVMDDNLERRRNRLALLRGVQEVLGGVADLSRLPG